MNPAADAGPATRAARRPVPPAADDAAWRLLAAAGVAFWFAVAWPWAPHNEGFDWVVRLATRSLPDVLRHGLPAVVSWRPIGVGLAWLLFRAGGGTGEWVQIANALFTLLAWWRLSGTVPRRAFGLLGLLAGGAWFAGYIYLFHIHGVFYGPLLLVVVELDRAAGRPLTLSRLAGLFALGALGALVHPFCLPFAVAFAAGSLVATPALRRGTAPLVVAALVLGAAGLDVALTNDAGRSVPGAPLTGWLTSFALLEVKRALGLVAALFAVTAAAGAASPRRRAAAAAGALALTGLALALRLPATLAWIAVVLAAAIARREWARAGMLALATLLPALVPTGTPTYTVPAVMLATGFTARLAAGLDARLARAGSRPAWIALALLVGVAAALRAGAAVPGVSAAARPLLAEREHTWQLMDVVDTLCLPRWRDRPARLLRDAGRPVDSNGLDRRFRPPTNPSHFITYLDFRRGGPAPAGDSLLVTFGGETVPGARLEFGVRGPIGGDALVFSRPGAARAPDLP
jgi:hypothetical protein